MPHATITIVPLSREHFDAVAEIERSSGSGSLVALTAGHALAELLERGHEAYVALEEGRVAAWAWFTVTLERGGENVGVVQRLASAHGRSDAALQLLGHVRQALVLRGCARARATLAGDDAASRDLFVRAGFVVDAVTMELEL